MIEVELTPLELAFTMGCIWNARERFEVEDLVVESAFNRLQEQYMEWAVFHEDEHRNVQAQIELTKMGLEGEDGD